MNGSFWLGAAAGSGASLLFLDPNILPINLGWRLGFAVGGVLGLGILLLRWYVAAANHSGVAWVWEISYRGAGLKREILRAQWIAPGSSKPVSEMAPTQRMGGHGVPGRHQPPPGKVLFTRITREAMKNYQKSNVNNRRPGPTVSGHAQRWVSDAARADEDAQRNYERYLALARAEAQSGNTVAAENYYQHAEHYFRSMSSDRAK